MPPGPDLATAPTAGGGLRVRRPRRGTTPPARPFVALAREQDGSYVARSERGGPPRPPAGDPPPTSAGSEVVRSLETAVAGVRAVPVDDLSETDLAQELAALERVCRQLSARQSRVVAALASRRSRRARDAARADGRAEDAAAQHATRELRRELSDELGWSPSESKRTLDLGRRLDSAEEAGRAFDGGELSARHASVLADTLRHIGDVAVRRKAQDELLALASHQDAVEFGRSCRRLLARLDADAARDADARRRSRRSTRAWQSEDGMTGLSAQLAGLDAETVMTAWHAFRRPDGAEERRSPEQAGADALVAMARAALDAGVAPNDRRIPPHVQVTIDWQDVVSGAGVPEGAWTGPLPAAEIRRLLADCRVSRLLLDADGLPFEAGEATRNVPIGLYRTLVFRDGGCIGDGCDVPAVWCQVMHLETPYRLGGRLSLETAALGCEHHHTKLDTQGWKITWQGGRPILHHPDRPPAAAARPGTVSKGSGSGPEANSGGGAGRREVGSGPGRPLQDPSAGRAAVTAQSDPAQASDAGASPIASTVRGARDVAARAGPPRDPNGAGPPPSAPRPNQLPLLE